MQRIINIQGFDGGESDDIIKGPANSFYSGENVEIRKNLSALQLSPLMEDTGRVFDDNIAHMVSLETLGVSGGGILVCLDNGKIYLDGTLKETLNTGTSAHNKICGVGVNENLAGTQYIYYISETSLGAGEIHRSTTNLATFNVGYRDYTVSSGNTGFAGVINDVGLMYIATRNKVFLMDKDEIVQDYLELPSEEEIMGFTQFQGEFTIYSNIVNNGVQYKWDGVSEAVKYRQEWENLPILGVTNDGAYDFVTLGLNEYYSDLYRIAGTQKQKVRTNLDSASYSRQLGRYLSMREGILYISGGKTGQSSNYGVYTYGNYYPGAKQSLVQSYSGTSNAFLHQAHDADESYFACADNKVYTISHDNPPTDYATSGYVITNMYQGYLWEDKAFDYMKVGFKLNGGEIKIYARTNMRLGATETTWILIKTIDNATYGNLKSCRIDANELNENSAELGVINEIQLKFVLTPSGDGGDTPELYSPTLWLKVTNDK